MCGIVGWFGPDNTRVDVLERMISSISHRGPDAKKSLHDGMAHFGFSRLSVVNLDGGMQPVFSEDKMVAAVGNGEIYNYKNIQSMLAAQYGILVDGSDISIIPHLYKVMGVDGLSSLRGMYGVALWDKTQNIGYLLRDPSGIKPLYYAQHEGKTYFASEIKALIHAGVPAIPDIDQLRNTLLYRSSLSHKTCFSNIYKVLPGQIIRINKDQSLSSIELRDSANPSDETGLEEVIKASVSSHLMSDVPVGVFLSGGIDSGLLAAMMAKQMGSPVKSYTVGYNSAEDERAQARFIAEHIHADHKEVNVTFSEMSAYFNRIVWHMDEPILDPSIFPSYFLSREASREVKVVLSGEGSDEVFAGYDKHAELLRDIEAMGGDESSFRQVVKSYLAKRMPFGFKTASQMGIGLTSDFNALVAEFVASSPQHALKTALGVDRQVMLPSLQLMRVDRATMAHGLEARVPFLDATVIQMANGLGKDGFISNGETKFALREVARKYLPNKITNAEKRVFYVPIDRWIWGDVRGEFERRVSSSEILPEVLDIKRLRNNVHSLSPYQLWSLAVIDSWHNSFIKNNAMMPTVDI